MRSFWSDPYLWVHLAGIAALPIFLELCLVGLAMSSPLLPVWMELLLVGSIGILPILWMQWQRPFSIFSLLLVALKPTRLTDDQRRILHRFKSPVNRGLAVFVAIVMAWVLWQLYQAAPLASPSPYFATIPRVFGLLLAAIAFLGCNLFVQIPVSVLAVLATTEAQFVTTEPYAVGQIAKDFTLLGIPVLHLLPPLISEPKASITTDSSAQNLAASNVATVEAPDSEGVAEEVDLEAEAIIETVEESPARAITDIANSSFEPFDPIEELGAESDFDFGSEPEFETQEIIQNHADTETDAPVEASAPSVELDEESDLTETIEIAEVTEPTELEEEVRQSNGDAIPDNLSTEASTEFSPEPSLEMRPESETESNSNEPTLESDVAAVPDIVEDESVTETWELESSQDSSDVETGN